MEVLKSDNGDFELKNKNAEYSLVVTDSLFEDDVDISLVSHNRSMTIVLDEKDLKSLYKHVGERLKKISLNKEA